MNWMTQVVTRTRQVKVEKRLNGIKGGVCTFAVQVAEHSSFASSEGETSLVSDLLLRIELQPLWSIPPKIVSQDFGGVHSKRCTICRIVFSDVFPTG